MGEDLRHVHFITEEGPAIRVSQIAEEKQIRMSNKLLRSRLSAKTAEKPTRLSIVGAPSTN